MEAQRADFLPRTTPVSTRFCYRQVPGFDPGAITRDRNCAEHVKHVSGFSPMDHFQMRERRHAQEAILAESANVRGEQEHTRRVTLWVGVGTIITVAVTGLVSAIIGILNLIF